MWNRLAFSAKYLLRGNVAGRMAEVSPDAVFLVSFPKSGNTWTRFLIGNLTHPEEPVTFANVDRIVPDIYGATRKDIRNIPSPRVLKSHEPFDPRYRRIIYIIRDPRDVALSSYHFARKGRHIEDSLPLETYVSTMFLKRGHTYGNWGEHTGSWLVNSLNVLQMAHPKKFPRKAFGATDEDQAHWLGARGHGRRILLLRYEDLIDNTEHELSKVADFLGINASPERIAGAVELSTADKMRRLEQKQSDQWGATKEGRKDINFVREAKSGQWQESLSASAVAEIESNWGHLMQFLGYKLQRGLIEQLEA